MKINFWLIGEGIITILFLSTIITVCVLNSIIIIFGLLICWIIILLTIYMFFGILLYEEENKEIDK